MIGSRNESCNGAAAVPHATQTTDTRPITSDGRSTALACLHSHPMNRDPTVPEQSLVERCLWAITARPVLALVAVGLLTLLLAAGLPRLYKDTRADAFVPPDHPAGAAMIRAVRLQAQPAPSPARIER